MLPLSSICYSGSLPNKKVNEDAHYYKKLNGTTIFAVADGLGSYSEAAKASTQVIEYLKKNETRITTESKFLSQFFHDVNDHLCKIAKVEHKEQSHENLLGTTLILGIETENEVTFAHVGNGAIIHVRGTIADFCEKDNPWFATNLLNPHTIPNNGEDVLYKLLSNYDNVDVQPTIIRIEKDRDKGDAFIICTDGIASQDHVKLFKHSTVGFLSKNNEYLHELFTLLKDFQSSDKINAFLHLSTKITLFLEKNKDKFEDDATLAILVTDNFLKSI